MKYHVCKVLRMLTKQVIHCVIDNVEIPKPVGAILNRILVVNQIMVELIKKKTDIGDGIESHIQCKYDIDDVWQETDALIEEGTTDENSKNKLTVLYKQLYLVLNQLEQHDRIDTMIELTLNGLYLGKIMEMEIDELYGNEEPHLDFDTIHFLENERRPHFFKYHITNFVNKIDKAEKVLCI